MNGLTKKILSVIIALVVVVTPLATCFAGYRVIEGTQDCPFIYIHGFMGESVYLDKDDPDSILAFPPSADEILSVVKDNLGNILSFLITKDYDRLAEVLIEPCRQLLCKGNLGYDGEIPNNSGIRFDYPAKELINSKSQLSFDYDWRLDPIYVAQQLNDYIEYVCDASGCDQVTLECHSFGGVVTISYLTLYGLQRVKGVCYNSTAIYGEDYTGMMLSGGIKVEDDSVTEFLKEALGENEYSKLFNGLFDILKASGLTGDICNLANNIVKYCGASVIREVVAPMFAGWLSIWAMIPDQYVDACKDYVFNTIYKDDGIDHSGLIAKIDDYNTRVRAHKTETLMAQNKVANVYCVARYGYCSVPTSDSWSNMSDSVIDLKYASWGATCGKYNEKLSKSYIASHNAKYISPDENVDASTCLFPEQTWFLRGMKHSESYDSFDNMMLELLCYDGQATVDTFEQYPQFLYFDRESELVVADYGTPAAAPTVWERIFSFCIKIITGFKQFFNDIKWLITLR